MRVVLQRVTEASVHIEETTFNSIVRGILVFAGFEDSDSESDIEWLANKIVNLRIFNDTQNIMNLSVMDLKGEILVISQFTLFAQTKKGNRPSYIRASKSEIAIPLYNRFIEKIQSIGVPVKTGIFGADMKVHLINDGPVTIIMDTKNKE